MCGDEDERSFWCGCREYGLGCFVCFEGLGGGVFIVGIYYGRFGGSCCLGILGFLGRG